MFRPLPTIATLLILLGGAVAIATPTLHKTTLENSLQESDLQDPIFRFPDGAIAQNLPSSRPGGMGWLRDLNLSSEQMQQMRSIRGRYKNQLMSKRQAARQAQQELRSLMSGGATAGQIREKYRQAQTLHQQLADTQFNSLLEMREILTPQQRQKFAERMERHRREGRGRPQRMGQDL
ncbi:MAG: Spy/CpxP family protein refolding chaperone [Leptolyngbyaceae cyanobacterium CSU_1_3]|nr:Spy/CpxP family protein refolding chaperone [Leptolyngbyaceae cyanobacterium CSU_1_3]